jgi:DNA polymerase III alpha subunit
LAKIPRDLSILSVTSDGIYDSYTCYDEAKKHGAVLITPPRKNAVMHEDETPRGEHIRAGVIKKCNELGRKEWKKEVGYHKRSRVESGMYRYKSSCGDKMFSRGFERQTTEAMIKVNMLNNFRDRAAPVYV